MTSKHDTSISPRALHFAVAAALAALVFAPAHADDKSRKATAATEQAGSAAAAGKQGGAWLAAEREFFKDAARSSEKEIAAARLAREKTSSDRIRDLADKMERDHQSLLRQMQDTTVAMGIRDLDVAPTALASSGESGVREDISGRSGETAGSAAASGASTAAGTTAGAGSAMGGTGSGAGSATVAGGTASDDPMLRAHPDLVSLSRREGAEFDREFLAATVKDHEKRLDKFTKASTDKNLDARARDFAVQTLPTLRSHLEMVRMLRDDVSRQGGASGS